ncbi:MAG: hypothetical protein WAM52_17590 [Steroidobacteraceae bacterium]
MHLRSSSAEVLTAIRLFLGLRVLLQFGPPILIDKLPQSANRDP